MLGNFKISKASHFYKIEQPKKTENEIATTSRHIWNVAWSPWSFLTQLSLLHLLLIQQPLINISSTFFSILFLARINICNFLASKFSEICYFYDKYITETSLWFWGFNMIVLGQIHKEKTITFLQYVIHVITLVSTAWLFIPLFGLELSRHGARSYLHILILFDKKIKQRQQNERMNRHRSLGNAIKSLIPIQGSGNNVIYRPQLLTDFIL